uniref:Uncharacterized protein n=1 Tax=Anguilla anguilla TaxID=7936 RepID=A0A0E9PPP4_ANGAN
MRCNSSIGGKLTIQTIAKRKCHAKQSLWSPEELINCVKTGSH